MRIVPQKRYFACHGTVDYKQPLLLTTTDVHSQRAHAVSLDSTCIGSGDVQHDIAQRCASHDFYRQDRKTILRMGPFESAGFVWRAKQRVIYAHSTIS